MRITILDSRVPSFGPVDGACLRALEPAYVDPGGGIASVRTGIAIDVQSATTVGLIFVDKSLADVASFGGSVPAIEAGATGEIVLQVRNESNTEPLLINPGTVLGRIRYVQVDSPQVELAVGY